MFSSLLLLMKNVACIVCIEILQNISYNQLTTLHSMATETGYNNQSVVPGSPSNIRIYLTYQIDSPILAPPCHCWSFTKGV